MTPETVAAGVRPEVDTEWLALPLSARGLADELSKYADEGGGIRLRLAQGSDAKAIGGEIARLLCAHRGEIARVRRDAKALLDAGTLVLDRMTLRLSAAGREAASTIEHVRPLTPAERSQRYRDRRSSRTDHESSSMVTRVTDPRDEFRDERDAVGVTPMFSLKKDQDHKSFENRETVTTTRDEIPNQLTEIRRGKAKQLGLQDHRLHLVWEGFFAYYKNQKRTEQEWDDTWTRWVTNRLLWDSQKSTTRKTVVQSADLDAPWMRKARGE
ncbi:MAG: hypothetical protein ACRELY_29335 [Polyangiaceae bacterium]